MSAAAVDAPSRRFGTFATLRHQQFRYFWLGMLGSVFGLSIDFLAAGWLVLQLTNSPLSLGATGLFQAIPNILLTSIGGAMADRVNRGKLLCLTQGTFGALYIALGLLVVSGLVQVWHVYAASALFGAVRAFDSPARQAIVPALVPEREIAAGVALVNVVWLLPRLVGPAMAGVLIAVAGIGPTYFVAAAGMGLAVLMFSFLRLAESPAPAAGESVLRSMRNGLDYIRRDQVVFALIGLTFFNSVFGMSYMFLLPVFARDVLAVGAPGLGMLQALGGVGGIVGVLIAARVADAGRRGWVSLVGAAAYGVLLVAFGASPWFGLSVTLNVAISVAHQIYMTVINTVLLLIVPDEFRGRVLGVYGMTWSLMPLGAAVTGAIAELAGAPFAVALGGALVALVAVGVAVAAPRARALD